jgi:hypothetical protein
LCDAQPATRLSLAVVRVVAAACTRITTAGTGVAVWRPAKQSSKPSLWTSWTPSGPDRNISLYSGQ